MSNIFTYLEEVQHDSIYDRPFNELDLLILTELTYLPFDQLVHEDMSHYCDCRLLDLADQVPRDLSMMVSKNRLKLLDLAAASTRFKNLKLMGYVNDVDQDIQKQFAALIFKINPDTYVLVFRGTDDSIVGWKEDFHMTYMDQIPAQKMAARYLQKALENLPGSFILTGHSKGGNLASYAASQMEESLQDRIEAIYSYDSPGLNHSVIESDGYQTVVERMKRYLPQNSIVGMMLETPKEARIVKSSAIGGFAQHDTFSWKIKGDSFLLLDTLDAESLQIDKTFKNWVSTVSDEELKDFFDLFFGLILDAGIQSVDELSNVENFNKVLDILKNAQSLTDQERDMLLRLSKLLLNMRVQSWKDDISIPNLSEIGKDIRENLSRWSKQLPFGQSETDKVEETATEVHE